MPETSDILLSLKPKYANSILSGEKTVELRKRRPKIDSGTRVWLYSTTPVAAIVGCAQISKIESGTPPSIWKKFGNKAGVSKEEFDSYFVSAPVAHVLVLEDVLALENILSLKHIRKLIKRFQPPQFFSRLNELGQVLRLSSRKSRGIAPRRISKN